MPAATAVALCVLDSRCALLPPPSCRYGYHRVEVLGALASVLIIWLVTGVLVFEAVNRVIHPEEVKGKSEWLFRFSCFFPAAIGKPACSWWQRYTPGSMLAAVAWAAACTPCPSSNPAPLPCPALSLVLLQSCSLWQWQASGSTSS